MILLWENEKVVSKWCDVETAIAKHNSLKWVENGWTEVHQSTTVQFLVDLLGVLERLLD